MLISFKKSLIFIIPLFLTTLGLILYFGRFDINFNEIAIKPRPPRKGQRLPLDNAMVNQEGENISIEEITEDDLSTEKDQENELPEEFLLNVPFVTQSPYAVWDERDEESCEEASLVIVHYYWQKKDLTKDLMRQELDLLIDFQIQNYGQWKDSDAEEIARLARDYYDYQESRVYYDIGLEDIKEKIAQGNPVIIPAAGRLLGNPYFTPPGPLYHNLVLIGWNKEGFITNDPGTRRGENYFYPYDILYNAIHDFPGNKEAIEQGRKAMIIVK